MASEEMEGNAQSTEAAKSGSYDLMFVVDATFSMGDFLKSLSRSLPQIISVTTLTGCFERIGVLAYRDYDCTDAQRLEWSGWLDLAEFGLDESSSVQKTQPDLLQFSKDLWATGGACYPEAVKTGLAKAYTLMREDATTIMLLYADAPPHDFKSLDANRFLEAKALKSEGAYDGYGKLFIDWVSTCRVLSRRSEDRLVTKLTRRTAVFNLLYIHNKDLTKFNYLSTLTGGTCINLESRNAEEISRVTVALLLNWMQVEKPDTSNKPLVYPAKIHRYISTKRALRIESELDTAHWDAFTFPKGLSMNLTDSTQGNWQTTNMTSQNLSSFVRQRKHPVQNFAARYASDAAYKQLVVRQLNDIIASDIMAMTTNNVFGSLWRAVCSDRDNPDRGSLVDTFARAVERVQNVDQKQVLKAWLEESYDYSAEVQEAIESVPIKRRYPAVCLDPTLRFTAGSDDGDSEDKEITAFRRDELLEIGRSCDPRILRRLGNVLTRLTFVESDGDLPAHLAAANGADVPRLPLALASKEFGFKFWKILLHLVVPGTMLGARPATVLAALAIKMGIIPLQKAATSAMLAWKSKWNDLEVPETWNTSCLGLLLDADKMYREALPDKQDGTATVANTQVKGLLLEKDRSLFQKLVSYKLLELNLQTTLHARTGWKPEKTSMAIGATVECAKCHAPRSVTIMGPRHVCGLCIAHEDKPEDVARRALTTRVSTSEGVWVECAMLDCRAQYVVYNVEDLNVRAKCHYCRSVPRVQALLADCIDCLNRMIYPQEYRPTEFEPKTFKCPACESNRKSIIDSDTTAKELNLENGTAWLLSKEAKFEGRSLFHLISTIGREYFDTLSIFPAMKEALRLRGKHVHNTEDVVSQLQAWVKGRRAEQGECSLCFDSSRKQDLLPACGRRGCLQRIDVSCLRNWYGLNGPGRIINVSALVCPFCRRPPSAKTLAAYGMGIHAVGNLKNAVEAAGRWIYAWCTTCHFAKEYMERVCAAGRTPELRDWRCEECIAEVEEVRRRAALALGAHHDTQSDSWDKNSMDTIRMCPKCDVAVLKTNGCNHITCVCGTHFCYTCGFQADNEEDVYDHMESAHDGFYEAEVNEMINQAVEEIELEQD